MADGAQSFLNAIRLWAEGEPSVDGVALVGSHARGEARPGSDVDVVIISSTPDTLLQACEWIDFFGTVASTRRDDFGAVQSLRVWYEDGLEVEFGIADWSWASTEPLDVGTTAVVSAGMVVLLDKAGRLAALRAKVSGARTASS